MPGRTRGRIASSALVGTLGVSMAVVGTAGVTASPAGASPAAARIGFAASIPGGARAIGALAGSTVLHVDVLINPRNAAGLAAEATAVSTPGSALYKHFISVAQFDALYGPTPAAVAAVTSAMRSDGFKVGAVSGDHLVLTVSGTAAQMSRVFSTGFLRYDVNGRVAYANTKAPLVSANIASYVYGIVGLDNVTRPHHEQLFQPKSHSDATTKSSPHASGPQPCAKAVSTGKSEFSFTANQIAGAYNFNAEYSAGDLGAGQTVALFELENNYKNDPAGYASCYGVTSHVAYTEVDGGPGAIQSGAGFETALDIDQIIGLAPDADVDVFQGPNTNAGLVATYTAIFSADSAKVVSTSWGECESQSGATIMGQENTLFEEAATQGQSVYAAAGDDGSTDCQNNSGNPEKTVEADDPASQPYVTGAGGTKMTLSGSSVTQVVWNESTGLLGPAGAGGGGVSQQWPMPTYQSGAPASLNVINSNSSGTKCKAASGSYCREVPDISADADPYSGYVVYYDGSFTAVGGTSAAAPLWAALTALANASSACGGKSAGFANPALYKAGASAYATTFTDITSGNNDYTPSGYSGGLYPAGKAYDMASGLGTPLVPGVVAALCGGGGSGGGKINVTNPGAQTSKVGAKVSLKIQATDSVKSATLTYSAKELPKGVKIDATTGLISGTIAKSGVNKVIVTVKDGSGNTGTADFTWTHKS